MSERKETSEYEHLAAVLECILKTLEEIRSITILANQDKLEQRKRKLLPKGSIKERIYDLCDGTKTAKEIGEVIGKDASYVHSYLSILRREGLIRTIERNGRIVHEQII